MKSWNELSMAEKADVMKLAVEGGVYDLDSIRSGYNEYANGGKIHIKPENRGKFTALKKRTGHSATWFKEHGTPAQKKMATFALNSRKWKHEDGGNLYSGGGLIGILPSSAGTTIVNGLQKAKNKATEHIRQRLYDNVIPFGYNNPVERVASAVILNKPSSKQEMPDAGNYDALDELWATYLNIPQDKRHYDPVLKVSKYKPTKSKDTDSIYYSVPFDDSEKQEMIDISYADDLKPLYYRASTGMSPELGEYTIDRGRDSKGDYVSYYDKWDLNPFRGITNIGNDVTSFLGLDKIGDISAGIGKPVEVYDRIYLDDYYDVPNKDRGGHYLPEITIRGKKKAFGGETGNYYDGWGDTWNFLKKGAQKAREKVKDWGLDKSPAEHLARLFTSSEEAVQPQSNQKEEVLTYRNRPAERVVTNPFEKEGRLVPVRQRGNTSKTTKKESETLENGMRAYLANKDGSIGSSNPEYDIPFIPEKAILINGSTTSTNVLDSLAKYAGIHNRNPQLSQYPQKKRSSYGAPRQINMNEMLGLSTQETHNGAMPSYNYANSNDDKRKALSIDYKDYNRALGNANYFTAFGYIPAENLVRNFQYNDAHVDRTTPPLLDAFRYYAQGDYNPGDPNHTLDVNTAGKEVWENPEVKKWWNNSGKYWYNTGKGPK